MDRVRSSELLKEQSLRRVNADLLKKISLRDEIINTQTFALKKILESLDKGYPLSAIIPPIKETCMLAIEERSRIE